MNCLIMYVIKNLIQRKIKTTNNDLDYLLKKKMFYLFTQNKLVLMI